MSRGKFALVDDRDYERVSQFNWSYMPNTSPKNAYACRSEYTRVGEKLISKTILMHRFILKVTDPRVEVDHKGHNGLDNRRHKIRKCIASQNKANSRKTSLSKSSQYKGVSFWKSSGKWSAEIYLNSKRIYLGAFGNENEAAKAYNKAAVRLFGEFAYLNRIKRTRG